MKVTTSTKYVFEFTDLQKGVPHSCTVGLNSAIITRAALKWQEFDEPQEDLDGDTAYFDYTFHGYSCKANGRVDKRQKRESFVGFNRTCQTWGFIIELIESLENEDPLSDKGQAIAGMMAEAQANLQRALRREKEQLKRLLS